MALPVLAAVMIGSQLIGTIGQGIMAYQMNKQSQKAAETQTQLLAGMQAQGNQQMGLINGMMGGGVPGGQGYPQLA
ncbi:MAG: hypothetical protein AB1758_06235 [Candidatus Eremiobacterota bacterium]